MTTIHFIDKILFSSKSEINTKFHIIDILNNIALDIP